MVPKASTLQGWSQRKSKLNHVKRAPELVRSNGPGERRIQKNIRRKICESREIGDCEDASRGEVGNALPASGANWRQGDVCDVRTLPDDLNGRRKLNRGVKCCRNGSQHAFQVLRPIEHRVRPASSSDPLRATVKLGRTVSS